MHIYIYKYLVDLVFNFKLFHIHMDSLMEAVIYKIATIMPLAAGFLTFVAVECFVDQLVAPIKPTIGQYLAKYILSCSGPVVT